MLKIREIENRIISQSIGGVNNSARAESDNNISKKPDEKSKNIKILAGASALAAIAVGGFLVFRRINGGLKKGKSIVNEIRQSPVIVKLPGTISSNDDNLIRAAEKDIRKQIFDLFVSSRGKSEDIPEFLPRIKMIEGSSKSTIESDTRFLAQDDFEAVMSYLKGKLKSKPDLISNETLKRLNLLINDGRALESESFVYGAIRTQRTWDDFENFDFVKDLKEGFVIRNEMPVITSRKYNEWLACADPINYRGHEDCGYILRISLPEGTKGFDCRRCSQKNSDKGINALYILPSDSEFVVNRIDASGKIIDVKYIRK